MPLQLTPEQARAFLGSRGHDARELVPLSGGLWSTTFAFVEAGVPYVVRFHERRDDLEKDRFAMRWSSPRLRIPRIVEIGDAPEGAYGISEREAGGAIDDLDEEGMRAILPSLLATLDAVRDADVSGTTGYGLWHGDGNAPHASWRAMLSDEAFIAEARPPLAGSSVGTEAFDAGIARMRELVGACPEDKHVVHNDLLYRNLLAGPKGIVVLDWGASIYGDFLYDLALLTFWWPWYAARWGGIDIRAEIERHYREIRLRIEHFPERMLCYELDIGVSHIVFQGSRGRWDQAAWTAARTLALATTPLR
jgi:aminoglycoside phosphotransferase (APT) family kinase protein